MPISSPQPMVVMQPQTSSGAVKNLANQIRGDGAHRDDADLWGAVAKALSQLQSQSDHQQSALQSPISLPDPIQISDPGGALIASIGHMLGADNRSYSGIWTSNLYVGVGGPSVATFFTNGAAVVIGQNGIVEILDPYGNAGAWLGTQSEAPQAVTGAISAGGLIRLTVVAHGYRNGDWLNAAAIGGVPTATGQWVISVFDADHVDLLGSTFAGAYTSGGTVTRFFSGGAFETIAVAAGKPITGAVNNGSGLVRLTITAHGYATGYRILATNVGGVPGANGSFLVTVITANTVDLQGSVFSGAYTSGGISINWPTAKLLAQGDGSLLIQNALITLTHGTNQIILDPSLATAILGSTTIGQAEVFIAGGQIFVRPHAASYPSYPFILLDVNQGLQIQVSGHIPVQVTQIGGAGEVFLTNAVGSQVITIDGGLGNIDASTYSVAGVPGVDLSQNFGTSLTVNFGSAITSVTGAGITTTSGTFVTSVTLTTSAHTFAKGLLTS